MYGDIENPIVTNERWYVYITIHILTLVYISRMHILIRVHIIIIITASN